MAARRLDTRDDLDELISELRENPEFHAVYDRTRPEFELRAALIGARLVKGITQAQLAEKMGTTQSVVSRIEHGALNHRLQTFLELSSILGIRFEIAGGVLRVVPKEKGTAYAEPGCTWGPYR